MRHRRVVREPEVDPFYDMLFNMLIAFVFCFIVALIAMNPKALKAGDVPAKAEYLITVAWPDNDPNDIDTWVQSPAGEVVWYRSREAGLMHMDRDDRGASNDTVVVNGQRYVNPTNQEVVTLRGVQPGEYVVNVHYFESGKGAPGAPAPPPDPRHGQPVPVTLTLVKINPRAEVAYQGQATLARPGEEHTMLRFTIATDGAIGGLNTLPKRLVQQR